MFPFKWLRTHTFRNRKSGVTNSPDPPAPDQILNMYKGKLVTESLEYTERFILDILGENDDFVFRHIRILARYPATVCYLSTLTNESNLEQEVFKPLMSAHVPHLVEQPLDKEHLKRAIPEQILYHSDLSIETKLVRVVEAVLHGYVVVLVDGLDTAYVLKSRSVKNRSIEQPQTEQVVQGPREGFIEMLETNLALIRYRLPTPDFRIKTMRIGKLTKSQVAVCYIEGIANPSLVAEVMRRLSKIDIDILLDAGYLEQYIQDHHLTPFPQIHITERPDKAVANIAEGRVIILMDGSPFALIVPSVFSQFFHTAEDYTSRYLQGNFVRFARVVALIFSLVLPSLYVSMISFNPELIPTEFAVAVAGGRAGVPFPSVVEVLIMEVSMEVLREATIRLPQQVGGALSIVGVLVIGQAAVSAGFASPITVVVIALTTIGSFATPAYTAAFALRMLRFPLIILAGIFGLYGVMVGLILICNHLLSLKSFGVPYLTPIVPGDYEGLKDSVIRQPLWTLWKRPTFLYTRNRIRARKSTDVNSEQSSVLDPGRMDGKEGEH